MIESITKMTQDVVLEGTSPAKEVAQKIGKPYSTLLREINPFDQNAKLGAGTLLDILKATNEVRLLEHMAKSIGYTVKPNKVHPA
ncbi:phage regulatory CII family protein [Maridesulfovibrio ferrireducens]|uniref:phage regulatory CII family protein n=1 Tax=Maridesulfovibrio ferrireducens TaxID=246191 RepID=UPI001A1D72D4|nr:phage regulatory CII family protein [Maridesulfovibrio ferrireducens]MBI9110521.1 amino acid-binding protein [Maridesulfovibrio ferrireducens]